MAAALWTTVLLTGSGHALDALEQTLTSGGYRAVRRIRQHEVAAVLGPGTVVVAAFDQPAKAELQALDDLCDAAGAPWVPLRYQGGKAFLGPAVTPGATARFRDLLLRRRAAAHDERAYDASWQPDRTDQYPATDVEWAWVASEAAVRIEGWIAGVGTFDIVDGELEIDPIERTTERHHILMLPDRKPDFTPPPVSAAHLVDTETGIILRVRDLSSEEYILPPTLHLAVADVADMRRIFDWPNDLRAFGSSWTDEEGARAAAIGEAVERYCGNWLPPDSIIMNTSFDTLRSRGESAVDPDSLVLYSPTQYSTPGFPFAPFRRDSRASWIQGWSLSRARAVWVPAFLVHVGWHKRRGDEPRYAYPNLTGIAAGVDLDTAILSGLEEVVERDTSMIWWAHAQSIPSMVLPEDVERQVHPVADRFETRVMALPNEFGVPVAAGVVRDRRTGWLVIGTAVRPTFTAAALKALAEGFSLQHSCRSLDDPAVFSRIVRASIQSAGNLKAWRSDRDYLDAYRNDFHDVVELMCQLQVHLDPRATAHVAEWVWTDPQPVVEPDLSMPERSLELLRRKVEARHYDVIRVDVTTPDIAAVGLRVVRTIVPGLVANFPAAFPMWGRRRIQQAGVAAGWRSDPAGETELNTFPMPHA